LSWKGKIRLLEDRERREKLGIVMQTISGIIVGIGIGIEVAMGAELGYILISCGSLLYAMATKLRKI